MRAVLTAVAVALVVATPPLAYAAGREARNDKPYARNPRAECLARAARPDRPAAAAAKKDCSRMPKSGPCFAPDDTQAGRGRPTDVEPCDLDGQNGRLAYVGYDIDELARKATFEEVTYLLLHGELPKAAQLDGLTVALTAAREIPRELIAAFRLMPKATDPMRVLQ